VRLGVSV